MNEIYKTARDAFRDQTIANETLGLYDTDRVDPLIAAVDAVLTAARPNHVTCLNNLHERIDAELKALRNSWEYAYAHADQCAMPRDARLEPYLTLEEELTAAKEMLLRIRLTLGRAHDLPKTRAPQ